MSDILNKYYKGDVDFIKTNTLLFCRAGSHAYGTNTPESDEDFKGVCIAPMLYYLGYHKKFEQVESHDPDLVIFDIKKFFTLASTANPNFCEMFFLDPSDYLYVHTLGEKLLSHRKEFLSTKVMFSHKHYALSQLKRIKGHRNYILNPPKCKPERSHYNLPELPVLTKDNLEAVMSLINTKIDSWFFHNWDDGAEGSISPELIARLRTHLEDLFVELQLSKEERVRVAGKSYGFDDNFLLYVQKEKQYRNDLAQYNQYLNWQKNRNPKRAEMESKYFYDLKHSMHLCRLLLQAEELLTTGNLTVRSPHRDLLMHIRNGGWTYEQLIEFAENKGKELDNLFKTCNVLPKEPNYNKLDSLCMELIQEFYS